MYTVQRGDTLRRIAVQYGVSVDDLIRANQDVTNPNQIRVGQRIRIPNRVSGTGGWGRNDGGWGASGASGGYRDNNDVYRNEPDNTNNGVYNPDVRDYRDDDRDNPQSPEVPWLRLAAEEEQSGVAEYPGRGNNNPRIVEYHRSTNLPASAAALDETAWCASFVNWCLKETRYDTLDSAWALDWRNYGERLTRPEFGCVVVFEKGRERHVGFYIEGQPGDILTLGGNQSDRVCVQTYRDPAIAFRWPTARSAQYPSRVRESSAWESLKSVLRPTTERRDCRELLNADLNGCECSRGKIADVRRKLARL